MKIVFMGTPDFALLPLKALCNSQNQEVTAVVTQPDKPKGRGKKLMYPPVKEFAVEHGIKVLQPKRARSKLFLSQLTALNPDIIVVAAYGQLLPESVLNLPRYGCINIHASLLPAYRGAAPMQWSIINGDTKTGVTIQQMEKGLDTGDIILQKEIEILPEDNFGTLHDKMAEVGVAALLEALELIGSNTAVRVKQDDDQSTYASMITKELEHIDWNKSNFDIVNLIRGLDPFPGAYTVYNGSNIKIYNGEPFNETKYLPGEGVPGEITAVTKKGFAVRTADGAFLATVIQPQGGRRMNAGDYLRGHRMEIGKVLE